MDISIEPAVSHDATVDITAANGDHLYGTEHAVIDPPDPDTGAFTFTGGWDFSGGTGRFGKAAGSVTWSNGLGNNVALTTSRDMSGTLTYNGRDPNGALEFRYAPGAAPPK